MKITNLTLNKYTRMSNLPYDKFEFIPKSKINIILGSNGMGKSSLLKELLPNVEDSKKEYKEDGYKILNFEHNNRLYTLSYKRDSNQYSFIVDGVELNPSYNMKTFKRLIEEEFNLSKDVFNLLIGLDNFTTMTTSERKKWFTEILSDTDYDYGLYIYNKSRTRAKELNGMLKLINSKLLKEYEELKNNNINKENIKKEIDYLLNKKKKIINSIQKPINIKNRYEELKTNIKEYNKFNIEYIDDLDTLINKYKNEINDAKKYIESFNKEIDNYMDLLNNNEKYIRLEKELIDINKTIKDYKLDNILSVNEWVEIYNYLTDNYVEFIDINNGLKVLKEIKELNNNKILEEINILENKLKQLEDDYTKTEYEVKELNKIKNDKLECPKCGNIWAPNYDKDKHIKLNNKLKTLFKEIEDIKNNIKNKKQLSDNINEKKTYIWKLSTLVKSNNYLRKLINNKIIEDDLLIKIDKTLFYINNLYQELKNNIEKIKLLKRKEEIENSIKISKELNIDKNKINKLLNDISNKKIKYIEKLEKLNKEYNKLKNNKYKIEKKKELGNSVVEILKHLHKYKINKYKELKYNYDLKLIEMLDNMVNELKDKLTGVEVRENKIRELEEEKKELTNKKIAVNKIIEALSPNKGLLAKGLVDFINNIIDDMNVIISNIFDYDLSIKHIDLEEGKLDFNFKLISKGNEITDISKGSSGMREVIDLAFKLVTINILGIEDYPLILDEFGRALDPTHRSNAYEYINELSNEMFSQIFIVTHNEDVFSRFPNANIVYLDTDHYKK